MNPLQVLPALARRQFSRRAKPPRRVSSRSIDAQALEHELRKHLQGEVRFDAGTRALYATDASNFRQVPIGVVIPKSIDDVVETVRLCRQAGAPLLSRGGGTSLVGQCCNVAVMMVWPKYLNRVLEIDPATKTARVQPGAILDSLRLQAQMKYSLTFGPDPATHNHCTLGGMLGNNSCGAHAQMAGPVSHNVLELDVLTYDGLRLKVGRTSPEEIRGVISQGGRKGDLFRHLVRIQERFGDIIRKRFPDIPRRISGYNLNALLPENGFDLARALVGSEGTCVTILEAKLRLVHSPPHRVAVLVGFPDIYQAGDVAFELAQRFQPLALEGMDAVLVRNVVTKGESNKKRTLHPQSMHEQFLEILPKGEAFLLLEFGGETKQEAIDRAQRVVEWTEDRLPNVVEARSYSKDKDFEHVWKIRESGLGATARVPGEPDTWPEWEDSAVPPQVLGRYLRELRKLYDKYGYNAALYGHFGQGCVHSRISFDLRTAEGVNHYRAFVSEAVDLCLSYDGSLSGEHGDGQARGEFLPRMFGEEIVQAFREFKSAWDPDWKMNPGKVIDANPMDRELRLGPQYHPWQPETHFRFPDDDGRLDRATLRCVGVGKCVREGGGTMCPSYMVTKEEKHTTRGRAHLLFEMLKGEVITQGWRDQAVKESLDLCLACKGCKGDCPVSVDLATYKAEFLSHYFKGRLRPRPAYAMGLIMFWARLASPVSGFTNFLARTSPFRELLKAAGGLSPHRDIPQFAPESFQRWVKRQVPSRNADGPPVLLWPDTFNNYFFPETAAAARDALQDAGFRVQVPQGFLCCGRPLYDYGMLPTAKWMLRRTVLQLRQSIDSGVPIVGLEPSCVSVFRDELRNLFPDWELASQLRRQVFLFSEFMDRYASHVPFPQLKQRAVVHGHCHHKSLFTLEDEKRLLKKLGLEVEIPETGCCGMAGSFGYEHGEKYAVSVKCGERVLLPKVREASKADLIIADGFSCREQISQSTDRKALHIAQVVRMAQLQGGAHPGSLRPEEGWVTQTLGRPPPRWGLRVGVSTALVLGTALLASRLASKQARLVGAGRLRRFW